MKNTYKELIDQTYYFPQEGFKLKEGYLQFNNIDLKSIIDKYGTPLKLTYLPKIGSQIDKAKNLFAKAIKKNNYEGKYFYCYCTKSSHFSFIIDEVLKHGVHIETSHSYDLEIIKKLYSKEKITKDIHIVCNGFKTPSYTKNISYLINKGFKNVLPVLDSKEEFTVYEKKIRTAEAVNIGIRIAADEEPTFEFFTSRLGIRKGDVLDFYQEKLKDHKKFNLKMLHFFMNKGIKDDFYYWKELQSIVTLYCSIKKECPSLDSLNIGGGFPIKDSLAFKFNYKSMVNQIVATIKKICKRHRVKAPNIYTEFGSFTVGESGATIYSVIGEKKQNDKETWYMIDSSFITTLPDIWGIGEKFLMLPINKWKEETHEVHLGGLTCDSHDFYTKEEYINAVYLPKARLEDRASLKDEYEPLYVGFFHTGAYQDQISGYGGIKHCLVPSPKHIVIDLDKNGNLVDQLYAKEQSANSMLKILGY